ncbi:hypothetical protein [Methyloglobulus morosus]
MLSGSVLYGAVSAVPVAVAVFR